MRYLALACDYDGTLALYGRVDEATRAALERVLASGRKLIMVTGRELDELEQVCPDLHLFDWVVAENGALLYRPASGEQKPLGAAPPEPLLQELRRRIQPLSVGRVLMATRQPQETIVLEVIRKLGLEYQIIFNKGAVMVLPAGITKATGLAAALEEMGLSPHNVVGVGDAENDHAFLQCCECSAAVANALPMLKEKADFTTSQAGGAGVCEIIEELVHEDLQQRKLTRHDLPLGTCEREEDGSIPAYGSNVLIVGPSGSGKSSTAASFLERLVERGYQFCIIDPEGDYATLDEAQIVGDGKHAPSVDDILQVLKKPAGNVVVNLIGLPLADRPVFFLSLVPHLLEMRSRTGRPHWLLVDETHQLLPSSWQPMSATLPEKFNNTVFITAHAERVARAVLCRVDLVLAVGQAPGETLAEFCRAVEETPPPPLPPARKEQIVGWWRRSGRRPFALEVRPSRLERRRHVSKLVEGELSPANSFISRVPRASCTCGRRTSTSSCNWPRASMTPPGCTTCAAATIRAGWPREPVTPIWRRPSPTSKSRPASHRPRAGPC